MALSSSSPQLVRRAVRKAARILGVRRVAEMYYGRFGHRGAGTLSGLRVLNPWLNEYAVGDIEPTVTRACQAVVRPGWSCVDVGAHQGYFSLLFATLVGPEGTVTSFEAHPANAAELRRNVALNRLEGRVRIENMAVTDGASPRVDLYFGRASSSAEWNILGRDVEGNPTEVALSVAATSLDGYFPPGARIDFVKMDIEGAEELALPGMRRILRESRPLVMVEFHNPGAWARRSELLEAGYALYDVDGARWIPADEEPRTYQCLAVPREQVERVRL